MRGFFYLVCYEMKKKRFKEEKERDTKRQGKTEGETKRKGIRGRESFHSWPKIINRKEVVKE